MISKITSPPLVSIVIPTYNRASVIAETIASALGQNYPAIEVIVCDNASDDGSWEVIESIAQAQPKVRAFRNSTNLGPLVNWRRAIEEARGSFIKILWSDDLIAPEFVSRCMAMFKDDVGMVYTKSALFESLDDVNSIRPRVWRNFCTGLHNSDRFSDAQLDGRKPGMPVSPGCAVFRSDHLLDCLIDKIPNTLGHDSSKHAIGPDLLLMLEVCRRYPRFGFIDDELALFRAHADSISVSSDSSKLVVFYALARAHFAQRSAMPSKLIRKFNAYLYWLLARGLGQQFGFETIESFYVAGRELRFSALNYAWLRAHHVNWALRRRLRPFRFSARKRHAIRQRFLVLPACDPSVSDV